MFVSVYSYPNVILPLIGGIFLDKIGIRLGLVVFAFTILVGQTLFMIGGYTKTYWFMILGRVIFGLGGECLGVSISTITTQWFKGRELNLAIQLGMQAP